MVLEKSVPKNTAFQLEKCLLSDLHITQFFIFLDKNLGTKSTRNSEQNKKKVQKNIQ